MTPRQEGFVQRCIQRGVDPRAVVKFASEYEAGRQAARQQFQKRAEVLNKLTPYQRGFALRCYQRGIPATKVAEFCARMANR